MNGLRSTLLVIVLALGVIGIGATSVFGMTAASAVATVHAADTDAETSCLLHCFVAQDLSVDSGALAIDVFAAGMAIIVAIAVFSLVADTMYAPLRPAPLFRDGPRFLLTVCKKE